MSFQSLQASTLSTAQETIGRIDHVITDHRDLPDDLPSPESNCGKFVVIRESYVVVMQDPDMTDLSSSALQSNSVPTGDFSAMADRFLSGHMGGSHLTVYHTD